MDTFNLFGLEPEAITNKILVFSEVLQLEPIEDITAAFKRWSREKSVMPTPADIIAICIELKRERAQRGPVVGKPEWIQVIREGKPKPDDFVIAEFFPGRHLSPMEIGLRFGHDIFVSYRRAS